MTREKALKDFAKKLVTISMDDGQVSEERVKAVLEALSAKPPRNHTALLKAYLKLIQQEIRKSEAVIEYAGELKVPTLGLIQAELTELYDREIHVTTKETPSLIAGVRVHIADDVYDSSVFGRLDALAKATADA